VKSFTWHQEKGGDEQANSQVKDHRGSGGVQKIRQGTVLCIGTKFLTDEKERGNRRGGGVEEISEFHSSPSDQSFDGRGKIRVSNGVSPKERVVLRSEQPR